MVTERRLGTEENPDIIDQGKQIEIPPEEQTFDEQLAEALEVTLADDEIIIAEESRPTIEYGMLYHKCSLFIDGGQSKVIPNS